MVNNAAPSSQSQNQTSNEETIEDLTDLYDMCIEFKDNIPDTFDHTDFYTNRYADLHKLSEAVDLLLIKQSTPSISSSYYNFSKYHELSYKLKDIYTEVTRRLNDIQDTQLQLYNIECNEYNMNRAESSDIYKSIQKTLKFKLASCENDILYHLERSYTNMINYIKYLISVESATPSSGNGFFGGYSYAGCAGVHNLS